MVRVTRYDAVLHWGVVVAAVAVAAKKDEYHLWYDGCMIRTHRGRVKACHHCITFITFADRVVIDA